METLHYICGRKVNLPVTYRNNIYMEPFGLKYLRINLQYLCLYHPINNINVKIDDVIHGNDIITYNVAVMESLKKIKCGN